jgi:hypothetical protein
MKTISIMYDAELELSVGVAPRYVADRSNLINGMYVSSAL